MDTRGTECGGRPLLCTLEEKGRKEDRKDRGAGRPESSRERDCGRDAEACGLYQLGYDDHRRGEGQEGQRARRGRVQPPLRREGV